MDTDALRALIRDGAATISPKARIWPNGLGFDWRGSYSYTETPPARWCFSKGIFHGGTVYGEGPTPAAARDAAKRVTD